MRHRVLVFTLMLLAPLVGTGGRGQVTAQSRPADRTGEVQGGPGGYDAGRQDTEQKLRSSKGTTQGREAQGKIVQFDASGKQLTLEDGTVLVLPDQVKVSREALKKGAVVRARYDEKSGQKVVSAITVHARD